MGRSGWSTGAAGSSPRRTSTRPRVTASFSNDARESDLSRLAKKWTEVTSAPDNLASA